MVEELNEAVSSSMICSSDSGKRVTRSASRAAEHNNNEALTPVGKATRPRLRMSIVEELNEVVSSSKIYSSEGGKRATRSASRGTAHKYNKVLTPVGKATRPRHQILAGNVSMVEELNEAVSSSKICSSDSRKRVTRSASRATAHKYNKVLTPVGKETRPRRRILAGNVSMVEELNNVVSSSKIFSSDGGKRVTRSASRATADKYNEVLTPVGKETRPRLQILAGNVSMVEELNEAVSSSKICSSDSGKRVTRSASCSTAHKDNEVLTPVGKLSHDIVICIMADPIRCVDKKKVCNQVDKEQLGAKTKNTSTGDGHPALQGRMSGPEMKNIYAAEEPLKVQGWTKEQELALQGAYFSAKPTPQFWKEVAKMVPGKSAHECFEKIHSDNLTPPQPQRRSKAKRASMLSVPLSASQLLSPLGPKSKKSRHAKRKHYCSYKNARQLLYKQAKTDQKSGADLFSVLEPSFCLSPQPVQDAAVVSHSDCSNGEQSFSALRNNPSGLGDLNGASFNSPPVLKKIKNKALHEKYIDQLHIRETKRNVASRRAIRCRKGKNDAKENQVLKEEAIERAKSSLTVNARSAINQFLQQQSTMTGDSDEANDDVDESAEDEMEDLV